MTWGAWVKASSVARVEGDAIQILTVDDKNPGDFDRSLAIDTRHGEQGLQWSAFLGNQTSVVGATGVAAKADTWTFIAACYDNDNSTMTLFVNDTSQEMKTNFTSGHDFFDIGHNPGFGEFFKGTIDDVFVFQRALSDKEIEHIRHNGISPNTAVFKVVTSGSVQANEIINVGNAGDTDDTTFTVTIQNITGEGTLGLNVTEVIADRARNQLESNPVKSDQYVFKPR